MSASASNVAAIIDVSSTRRKSDESLNEHGHASNRWCELTQSVQTKLTLDRWAQIMGLSRLHFWGVTLPDDLLRYMPCSSPWFQESWMSAERVGRDDVALAIADAESEIESLVGYHLLPAWEEDEWQRTTRPFRAEMFNLNNRDVRGLGQFVTADWGYLLSGGIRSVEHIAPSNTVTYDNDGTPPTAYKNRATATFTLAAEIPDGDVMAYYPGHSGEERYRIAPVHVSHSAQLEYTVTFRREQALTLDNIETFDLSELRGVDGTDDSKFLSEVDIARVYNDPQTQAVMLWEGSRSCLSCGGTGCGVCGYATATACLSLRGEPKYSQAIYTPATWNAATLSFDYGPPCRSQPDAVRLWYYSGWRDRRAAQPLVEMDDTWARVVAHLAASKLDRPPCDCTKERWSYWSTDLAFASGAEQQGSYSMTADELGNPLGTRRGAVMAWRYIKRPGIALVHTAVER